MLNDLEKAQAELGDTRHSESNAAHNFVMLKQSLEHQLAQLNKVLEKVKATEAEFTTSLDAGKADLVEAEKSLAALVASQAASKRSCDQVAFDHVAFVKAFAEELKALADETQAARQERALCRTGSAGLAHFRNHDVGSETGEEPFAKVKVWSRVPSRSCRRRPRLKRARRRS